MKNYIKQHLESGAYGENAALENNYVFPRTLGWLDCLVNDSLIFSHRKNDYSSETFNEGFQSHDYYEVVFYCSGKVEYVCENDVYKPQMGSVFIFAPERMHTARLISDSTYERYVICFKRDFFSYCGVEVPLPELLDEQGHGAFYLDSETSDKLNNLLVDITKAAEAGDVSSRFLAYGLIISFFSILFGNDRALGGNNDKLPENVSRIKKYIDTYYSSIEGVSEIASYFFYSREHASRLFRQYFNITLSEYLMQRRVAESAKLLANGESVASACYAVGFRSVSSYINAFRRIMGCLPSEYKKRK